MTSKDNNVSVRSITCIEYREATTVVRKTDIIKIDTVKNVLHSLNDHLYASDE